MKKSNEKYPNYIRIIVSIGVILFFLNIALFVLDKNKCLSNFWNIVCEYGWNFTLPIMSSLITIWFMELVKKSLGENTINEFIALNTQVKVLNEKIGKNDKSLQTYIDQKTFNPFWLSQYKSASSKIYMMGTTLIDTIDNFIDELEKQENQPFINRYIDIKVILCNKQSAPVGKNVEQAKTKLVKFLKRKQYKQFCIKQCYSSSIKNQINIIDDNMTVISYSLPETQRPVMHIIGYDNFLYHAYLAEFTQLWETGTIWTSHDDE
ncbi:MAG: hypothetical protein LBK94_04090 [Prevotellaceae bacterium]|jgi:uncharacterized protein with HEPN domain|nr:hypothetical protein [Prevotellaceae bacterium]